MMGWAGTRTQVTQQWGGVGLYVLATPCLLNKISAGFFVAWQIALSMEGKL